MTSKNQTPGNKPDYIAYVVIDREGKDSIWHKVGVAWKLRNGKDGANVTLFANPIGGRFTLVAASDVQPAAQGDNESF